MKGRTPTAAEKRHMDAVREQGCYCCERLGIEPYPDGTLIHHSRYSEIGLHYNLTAWEKEWGKQEDIVKKINMKSHDHA